MKHRLIGAAVVVMTLALVGCGGGPSREQRTACLRVKDYDNDFNAEGRGRPRLLGQQAIDRLGSDLRQIERAAFRTSDRKLQRMASQARREWTNYEADVVATTTPAFVTPFPVWEVSTDVVETKARLLRYCDKLTNFEP